ncbi:MAG: hypothetical protein IT303_15190 [Dehalococcoidia bacterium]|nr:hypothetical protein [Dehalococcoidia bacterium]
MTRLLLPFLAAVVLFTAAGLGVSTARADATVESSTVESQYPQKVVFKLTASAPAEITDVTLIYELAGRGASGLQKPETLTPARSLSVQVPIDVNVGNAFVPVGSEFVYHWEITSADGVVTKSPEQRYLHLPTGKNWQTVENEIMRVYYHGDRKSTAEGYLKAGTETYERIGKLLLRTELEQVPVKVILFANEAEMQEAQQGRGSTYDAATVTCGTKHTNDIVYVIPVNCGSSDPTDTLRHEFGHILNQTAGEGTLTKLPSWLDEGTAVWAQSGPGGYETAFRSAARSNRLIAFDRLGTPSNDPALVGVFYGQSWAMVDYLIKKGGEEQFATFYATIKGGKRFDQALQQVYGFDLAGFEEEFLASVQGGSQATATATPRQQATAVPTERTATRTATRTPTPAAPASGDSSSGDGGSDVSTATIAIIGTAVLLALLGLLGFLVVLMMQNNRTRGGAPPGPA